MDTLPSAGDPEALEIALWRGSLTWRRSMQNALRALSLTLPQSLVVASLVRFDAETGDAVRQRELVNDTGLDKMTTSHAVRALEEQGLAGRGLNQGPDSNFVRPKWRS